MTAVDPDPATLAGSRCAFPHCDCPGDVPVCDDYEETSDEAWLARAAGGVDRRRSS